MKTAYISQKSTSALRAFSLRLAALLAFFGAPLAARADVDLVVLAGSGTTIGTYLFSGSAVNANLITLSGSNGLGTGMVASGTNIYVARPIGGVVSKYTTDGATVSEVLITTGASDLTISDSTLYVSANELGTYTTSGGVLNASLIATTFGSTQVFGSNLYGLEVATNQINKYTTGGSLVTAGLIDLSDFSASGFIALNDTGSFIYVTGGNEVRRYNTTTGLQDLSFTLGSLQNAQGLVIHGNDLYVANNGANAIGHYNATTGAAINAAFITVNAPVDISTTVASVPEPGTLALFGAGALTVFLRRRRVVR